MPAVPTQTVQTAQSASPTLQVEPVPVLSIIIVSWNTREYLAGCLHSIEKNAPEFPLEVIVVDSASGDGTPDMLRSEFPAVRAALQPENVGFVGGNNIGFALARGQFLLMLNPDTEVHGDALGILVRYLEANPTVGIAGPRTLNSDGSVQSTRRHFPTLLTGIFESTWLQPFAPRGVLDRYYAAELTDDDTGPVDWVQGSALLFRRAVYEQIGGLDSSFVMYSEETDFCKRARDAGWSVAYVGAATVTHHGGKSTSQASTPTQIHFQQSKLRYFRKHLGWPAALGVRLVLVLSYLQQTFMEGFKWAIGHKRDLRRARVVNHLRVIRALTRPERRRRA